MTIERNIYGAMEHKTPYKQRLELLLESKEIRYWLKDILIKADNMDCIDAYNDLELAMQLMEQKFNEYFKRNYKTGE
jgi:hypothetical protein